ncbi:tetratricopeptide repeat protein [Secundilactobacillus oryzae]|nr:tetratricopeptide repeat protein [Secundilactobacillus oryzae]
MIAQSYVTLGNNKQALAFALTALNEDNQDTDTLRLVAESLLALGNFDEAARYYDQVLEINPKDGKTAFDRGLVAMVLTEPFDDYFEKARELDPGYFKKQQEKLEGIEKLLNSQRQQDED